MDRVEFSCVRDFWPCILDVFATKPKTDSDCNVYRYPLEIFAMSVCLKAGLLNLGLAQNSKQTF